MAGDPGQVFAEAFPQVVVPAVGDRLAIVLAEQAPIRWCMAFPGVLLKVGHEGWGDGLPPLRLALLPQQDPALDRVKVDGPEGEGTAAPAGGFDVQAQEQGVEGGVVAGGSCDFVDFGEAGVGYGVAGAFEPAGFGDLAGRVVGRADEVVVDGLVVQASDCGDEVLHGAGPAAGVAAHDHRGADVLAELLDLRRGGFVQASVAPLVDDLLPVGV